MTGYRAAGAAARASTVANANAHTTSTAAPTTRHTSTAFRTRSGALSPESWTADRDRFHAVGIGDDAELATKTVLAQSMIERALDAEVRFAWLTADEAYRQINSLRVWLEETRCVVHAGYGRGDDVFTRTGAAAGRTRRSPRARRSSAAESPATARADDTSIPGCGCRCASRRRPDVGTGCLRGAVEFGELVDRDSECLSGHEGAGRCVGRERAPTRRHAPLTEGCPCLSNSTTHIIRIASFELPNRDRSGSRP